MKHITKEPQCTEGETRSSGREAVRARKQRRIRDRLAAVAHGFHVEDVVINSAEDIALILELRQLQRQNGGGYTLISQYRRESRSGSGPR